MPGASAGVINPAGEGTGTTSSNQQAYGAAGANHQPGNPSSKGAQQNKGVLLFSGKKGPKPKAGGKGSRKSPGKMFP